jgi:hypothetical protein
VTLWPLVGDVGFTEGVVVVRAGETVRGVVPEEAAKLTVPP